MEKKYYEVVSVQDELPSDEEWYSTKLTGETVFTRADYIPFDTYTTHWLRPVSGILLSVERYDALMKCVELLQDINDGDATSPYSSNYIGSKYSDRIDKSLQTLKQTKNE